MISPSAIRKQSGFTLVELAIVLVIIGLIISGILVGADLVNNAEIRKTISMVEKTNQAALTFRGKYQGVPGDITDLRAESFGLNANRTGAPGIGDGNSLVEGCSANATALGCENVLFYDDLTQARLVDTALGPRTVGESTAVIPSITTNGMATYLPSLRLRETSFLAVFPHQGRNYFMMATIGTNGTGALTTTAGVTPLESDSIDNKVDDGFGLTGDVRAITGVTANAGFTQPTPAAPAVGVCVSNVGGNRYNTGDTFMNIVSCQLAIRTSF